MALNKKTTRNKSAHKNWMGGTSYDIKNPLVRLQIAASSSFFGEPAYYHNGDSRAQKRMSGTYASRCRLVESDLNYLRETLDATDPKEWRSMSTREMMESAIDAALDYDIEATLKLAVYLRGELNFRATPQVILVRAAMHRGAKGNSLIGTYAPQVMLRLDEVMNQMAYFAETYGGGKVRRVPSRLKRAWQRRLESANDYQAAKYKLTGRDVSIFDAVNITHANSEVIDRLMQGKLSLSGKTWEAIISGGGSWKDAVYVMGHMALLRNLRNLKENKALTPAVLKKLKEGVVGGRQFPFRYYSAYRACEGLRNGKLLDALEECLEISIGELPQFAGRTISLVDNSGSAHGTLTSSYGTMSVATIGNLMGIITGKASEEGEVGVFGDNLEILPVRKKSSVFDMVKQVDKIGQGIGGATENGIWLFFRDALKNAEHYDNIFVYSDMQAGHGGLYGTNPRSYSGYAWPGSSYHIDVAKLVRDYRRKVNPNVNVFLVQTAGYQDALVPEFYDRTYILGGWSDGILRFADQMINMPRQ